MKVIELRNNNGAIKFNGVKNSGVECIYIKATEGTTFQDSYKSAFYGGAKSIGAKVGFYHFLVGTSAPETQAENFYKEIIKCQNDLVPMLDVEVNFPGLNDYIARFIGKFNQLTSMEIGLYTYTSFLNEHIDVNRFKSLKLWEANYNNKPWNLPSNGFINRVGHQYTEKGYVNGVNGVCDVNEFNEGVLTSTPVQTTVKVTEKATGKVAELQGLCNAILGTNLVIDNIWGNNTDGAVRKLPLCGLPYVQRGLTTWVQLRLGTVADGIFGQKTKEAVIAWQYSHSLSVDGIVGYNTYKSLALA